MEVFVILVASIFIALLIYLIFRIQTFIKFRREINKFPGRPTSFPLGDLVYFSRNKVKLFQQLREYAKEFPDGYRTWALVYPAYNLFKAEDLELILSDIKFINKESIYFFLYPWLKQGLLTSEGDKWKHRRKILTPTFHFNILRKFVQIFVEHSEIFVQDLKVECHKDKTDIVPLITKLTLDLICETAMGFSLDPTEEIQLKYRDAIYAIGHMIIDRSISILKFSNITYFFTSDGRKQKEYLKVLHSFTENVIKEREKTFKDSDMEILQTDDIDDDVYTKRKYAMLDLLIYSKRNGEIDDAGIREEVDTFMFEGHDTTAMAISYTVFMLANHKNLQKCVIQEIDTIFQDSTRNATYQDLQKMNYLEMFIKETLRLYPSVPFISRTLDQNVPIKNGKYTMPKGSEVHIHIYDLHRDPNVYPSPDKFDPERFSFENSKNRHPYAYVPFSAGPRNCIGQRFAMLEVKSVISSILRHYEINPVTKPENLAHKVDLVLRSEGEIYVKFRQR